MEILLLDLYACTRRRNGRMSRAPLAKRHRFHPFPAGETLVLAWPTPNRTLFDEAARFLAATRVNADYGKPGYTRDCGRRFHRGCDIAPCRKRAAGRMVEVMFTNCATGREYPSREPAYIPEDEVFCVYPGWVEECVTRPEESDFGIHLVICHTWPGSGRSFYTLYGHLDRVLVARDQEVAAGRHIGAMGTSSRSAEARKWMAIAPHLHFEVWNENKEAYDPLAFLSAFLPRP